MHAAVVIPFPVPYRGLRRRARAKRARGHSPFLLRSSPWELTLLPSPAEQAPAPPAGTLVFSLSC